MLEINVNDLVRIDDPLDLYYKYEAQVESFDKATGEYLIQLTTGCARGWYLSYSAADLVKI